MATGALVRDGMVDARTHPRGGVKVTLLETIGIAVGVSVLMHVVFKVLGV